jgi:hypothetical protein
MKGHENGLKFKKLILQKQNRFANEIQQEDSVVTFSVLFNLSAAL